MSSAGAAIVPPNEMSVEQMIRMRIGYAAYSESVNEKWPDGSKQQSSRNRGEADARKRASDAIGKHRGSEMSREHGDIATD